MSDTLTYRFEAGDPSLPVILALHGTGGDENDLVPLVQALLPGAAILSPRGAVLERWPNAAACPAPPVRLTQDPKPVRFGLSSRG